MPIVMAKTISALHGIQADMLGTGFISLLVPVSLWVFMAILKEGTGGCVELKSYVLSWKAAALMTE